MTKLISLEVHNFKKLSALHIDFKDGVTEISGPNGSGKSSTIDALWTLLQGLAVAPTQPIKDGAELAIIRGRLGDLHATRRFFRKADGSIASDITLRNPEGITIPAPQTKLNDLIGTHHFDPLDFIRMKPKDQFDVVRAFVKGFDFIEFEERQAEDYSRRTLINSKAEQEQAAANAIQLTDTPPGEPIDVEALEQRVQDASDENAELERRRARRQSVETMITANQTAIDDREQEVTELLEKIERLKAEVKHFEATNAELRKKLAEAAPLPEPVNVVELFTQLNAARVHNVAIDDWKNARDRKQIHLANAEAYRRQSEEITAARTEREQAKQAAIAKAHLPVDGLGFGAGVVFYNNVPFDQASQAEQMRVATAVSLSLNPQLPLVWIREASLLDDNSKRIVAETTKLFGGQVILETVSPSSPDAILLEDGHLKDVSPTEAEAPKPARSRRKAAGGAA